VGRIRLYVRLGSVGIRRCSASCGIGGGLPREDELNVGDFLDGLSFRRGALHFRADYIRGRRVKTDITLAADGITILETVGRGKAPLLWIERLRGNAGVRLVKDGPRDPS
jgi:hypothetical protein